MTQTVRETLHPSSLRLGRFIIRRRLPILIILSVLTALFLLAALRVGFKNPTIDLFPRNHPYVETFVQYQDTFGGAGVVILALEVQSGDVFNVETLAKVRTLTKALELLPAVNNYQVLSIAQRKIKRISVEDVDGYPAYRADPIMWPDVPRTAEEIAKLRQTVYTTGTIHGSLVSRDDQAVLVVAGFFDKGLESPGSPLIEIEREIASKEGADTEEKVEQRLTLLRNRAADQPWSVDDTLYAALRNIADSVEDENTSVRMIGAPVLLGSVYQQLPKLGYIFAITVLVTLLVLFAYFRDLRGVLIPLSTAAVSAIWGVGMLGVLDLLRPTMQPWVTEHIANPYFRDLLVGLFNAYFNPLVIVVPFIISATATSHAVQLMGRFKEEYAECRDRREAAVATFSGLLKPGLLSIFTDAAGVFIVIVTPIPLMEKLALMGSFWVISIIVSDLILNPILLSYIPPPKDKPAKEHLVDRMLGTLGRWVVGWQRWVIVVVALVVFGIGLLMANRIVIGDVHPGTPLLWPSSSYNQDTAHIAERFGNTEIMSVVVEGSDPGAIKNPEVLKTMEALQRDLEMLPEVTTTSSIADLLSMVTRVQQRGHPFYELIPNEYTEAALYLELIFGNAEPGDLNRFITTDFKDANISVYLSDHKGDTLRAVIARTQRFIEAHPMEQARFRLAGNMGGLLAAVNETIVASQARVTIVAFMIVFLFCAIIYRSVVAGLFFLVPIAVSNYMTYAVMGAVGIGLDVNALPVISLGVGLGVDFGLYVIGRLEEEFRLSGDLAAATAQSIKTAGKAVLFTASTMVAGVVFWAFSYLRFQAEMGILLAFWMITSMLGGLILLPTLVMLIKPRFITKQHPAKNAE
ncbi:MAG: MMPL family transporter [Candidatus Alcyoniella australis]|nr:MMPL family transporter [Candidatus Alcyoniella australis]